MGTTYYNVLTLSVTAAGTIRKYRALAAGGLESTEHGGAVDGFAMDDGEIGEHVPYMAQGVSLAISGAAISAVGLWLQTDDEGRLIPSEGGQIVARSRETAAAAGETVQVEIVKSQASPITEFLEAPVGGLTAGLAVSPDGSALATAGEFCRGIATKTRTVGKQTPVQVAGIVTGIAGAAISAAGLALEVGSAGKLIPQSTGKMVAISLGTADEDGDPLQVLLAAGPEPTVIPEPDPADDPTVEEVTAPEGGFTAGRAVHPAGAVYALTGEYCVGIVTETTEEGGFPILPT